VPACFGGSVNAPDFEDEDENEDEPEH
jgi:hypothetical protein